MVDEEKFFAWLDGELAGTEAAEVEALVAADTELSARAAEHRALAGRLRAAFDPIAATSVPERLATSLKAEQPGVVSLATRRASASERRSGGVPQWAAMAATLAIGIFVGTLVAGGSDNAPLEARDGAIYAAGSLDNALERQLASAGAGGSDTRVGLTFRNPSGSICRGFTGEAASGLACREGEDWRLRGLFASPEGQSGDYRMAAGADPNLAGLIDSTMAGDPFDAEQEAAARNRGWR